MINLPSDSERYKHGIAIFMADLNRANITRVGTKQKHIKIFVDSTYVTLT